MPSAFWLRLALAGVSVIRTTSADSLLDAVKGLVHSCEEAQLDRDDAIALLSRVIVTHHNPVAYRHHKLRHPGRLEAANPVFETMQTFTLGAHVKKALAHDWDAVEAAIMAERTIG